MFLVKEHAGKFCRIVDNYTSFEYAVKPGVCS